MSIKRFLSRYTWTGPIIGFLLGVLFGPGSIWKYAEFRQKNRSIDMEQIRLEKDLYERLQVLQNNASSAILEYISLHDRRLSDANNSQMQNAYNAAKENVVTLVREYNRLEVRLSGMEGRSPRFFILPLPRLRPVNLRIEKAKDGEPTFRWDVVRDPVVIAVEEDGKALFEQYGHKFPSDK